MHRSCARLTCLNPLSAAHVRQKYRSHLLFPPLQEPHSLTLCFGLHVVPIHLLLLLLPARVAQSADEKSVGGHLQQKENLVQVQREPTGTAGLRVSTCTSLLSRFSLRSGCWKQPSLPDAKASRGRFKSNERSISREQSQRRSYPMASDVNGSGSLTFLSLSVPHAFNGDEPEDALLELIAAACLGVAIFNSSQPLLFASKMPPGCAGW